MTTTTNTPTGISGISKILLLVSALLLVASIFNPIWRIELDAPQYPEGLVLLINANGIGGNVDIINGLNHYIGMKTLHNEDFIEFTILPYLIAAFAIATFIAIFSRKKRFLNLLLFSFIIFGIVAMIDFWKWEYNYGHNLDPNAAIIVPGMAYQPPLIGFKQLLNFGAYSVPDIGGWMFIGSGLLMLLSVLIENKFSLFTKNKQTIVLLPLCLLILEACNGNGIEPIRLNTDNCDYCKMTISDARFASELITPKGRAYKFDDVACMLRFKKENVKSEGAKCYISDFISAHQLHRADSLFFIQGDDIISPMGGNIAAFSNSDSAEYYSEKLNALPSEWKAINQ